MSHDLNQCQFIGRLGADPETRYSTSGDAICSFSVACGWKTKDKEGTEWIPVTAFGKLGEICGQYLKKGSQVFVQGRFKTDKYEKDGQTRYSTKIVADTMQMLGGKSEAGDSAPARPAAQKPAPASKVPGDHFDDDIPFADPYKFTWRVL